jgi:hypothetical protein
MKLKVPVVLELVLRDTQDVRLLEPWTRYT